MTRIDFFPCLNRYAPDDSAAAILPAECAKYAAAFPFARNRQPRRRLRGGPVQAIRGRAKDWRCESLDRRTGECRKTRLGRGVAGRLRQFRIRLKFAPWSQAARELRPSCARARPECNATYPRHGQYAREADGA